MNRLGEKGDITIANIGCNSGKGLNGLEELGELNNPKEFIDVSGNHKIDFQLNIKKFGQEMYNGLQNTKEMAHAWDWKSDNDELNWRNKPCALRTSYDPETKNFKIHVWNELLQIWIKIFLSREEILNILNS